MPPADRQNQLSPPPTVVGITRDLERAGFQAWCVGGAVRDALLGHPHLDWDLATDATPDQVRSIFGRKRTVPVGIEFGTVGILDESGVLHEITTFRRDVRTDGRHAVVEFGASLDEDLARRDFTVNAIAYSCTTRVLHDPFDGRGDLDRGIIRAVGDPEARMREDRLRALRALRFAARFGFEIEPGTWRALAATAPHLTHLSAERVRQELEKTMDQIAAPSRALALWRQSGALAVLVPEIADVPPEVLTSVDCAAQPGLARRPGRRLLRLAALFSAAEPAALERAATRLRFSRNDTQWLATLVARWWELGPEMARLTRRHEATGAPLRRWLAAIGRPRVPAFFRLASAHWSARRQLARGGEEAPSAAAVHELYRRSLVTALRDPLDLRDLALDGDDLRQLGITPGPNMGKILTALLRVVLEDPALNTRERLIEEARRLHSPPNAG